MRRTRIAALALAAALTLTLSPLRQSRAAAPDPLSRLNHLLGTELTAAPRVTREVFLSASARLLMGTSDSEVLPPFEDLNQILPENIPAFTALYEAGIITGSIVNGKRYAKPEALITRQDAFTLLARLLDRSSEAVFDFTDLDSVAPYAMSSLAWFVERGLIHGQPDGTVAPLRTLTVNEMAVILLRAYDYSLRNQPLASTLAGTGNRGASDGTAETASFTLPGGVFLEAGGTLLVADTYNNLLRRISDGSVTTLAGSIKALDELRFPKGYLRDGDLSEALMNRPMSAVAGTDGAIYVADSENHAIRQLQDGQMTTFCGGTAGYADGVREQALLNGPGALAMDDGGTLYVADTLNHCIRTISPDGVVSTLAGTPGEAGEGYLDGEASSALFREPSGLAVSPDGSALYIADTGNHVIRMLRGGVVTTVAGMTDEADEDGRPLGGFADGTASGARFRYPSGLALAGDILIVADTGNHLIRALTPDGRVVSVCGRGEPGDADGPALDAALNAPSGVCYDGEHLYIADTANNKIKTMPFDAGLYLEEVEK